jgi:hypothetical protein
VDLLQSQRCKAVLAVNYFGFAQDLSPFREYCSTTGATLIEDNAHGFLSKDSAGKLLGTRANLGITSIRKTFRLPNGAALYASSIEYSGLNANQLDFQDSRVPKGFRLRKLSAQIQRSTGIPTLSFFQFAIRIIRLVTTGSRLPRSTRESETELPIPVEPHRSVLKLIQSLDTKAEVLRRQQLFNTVLSRVQSLDIEPIFHHLDVGTSPYGFAFIGSSASVQQVSKQLHGLSVEIIHWPDLPDAVSVADNHFYRNVWVVNFL